MSTLTPHGKTPDICKFVIERYKDRSEYKDNKTVQQWVQDSIKEINRKSDND